ncbi:unnamed protein product [Toxocara canis]|uniref:Secreted protein n=1 Tax=Toxocara canis TaxID=6265 RepID=A0A183UAU4_TOXCA|nr:unnamed protein product [Toxocara canis]
MLLEVFLMQLLTVGVLLILLDSSSSFYMLAAPGRLYRLRDDPMRSFRHGHFGDSPRMRRDYHATDDPLWLADFNNQNMKAIDLNG